MRLEPKAQIETRAVPAISTAAFLESLLGHLYDKGCSGTFQSMDEAIAYACCRYAYRWG